MGTNRKGPGQSRFPDELHATGAPISGTQLAQAAGLSASYARALLTEFTTHPLATVQGNGGQPAIPPQPRQDILALGEAALTKFKLGIHMMKRGGYISDHDALIGLKIATVMSGGDLTRPTRVSEQYLLDLEREAFVSLCGTKATQERIAHMLKTGKPLRN